MGQGWFRFKYTRILWCIAVCSLLCLPTGDAKNTHSLTGADTSKERESWWGDASVGWRVSGCTHSTSGNTSTTISSCKAYVKNTSTPLLQYVEDTTARTVTYAGGNGTYWLAVSPDTFTAFTGWTRVAGTHYLYKLSATSPAATSNLLFVMKVTVSGGAITAVDTGLAPVNPQDFDRTVHAAAYGFVCDGSTDNSTALVAAHDALPSTGGKILLPAGTLSCKFGTSFVPTKKVWLQGAGGEAPKSGEWRQTELEYTGSGIAISLSGSAVSGSILEGFELNHSGTATTGIQLDNISHIVFRDVTISIPTVAFSSEAINLAPSNDSHTITFNRVHVRKAAPDGVSVNNVTYLYVHDSTIQHHSGCNMHLGESAKAKDLHIVSSRLEVNESGYTSAVSLCIKNVEGLFVDHSHFEMGEGANWAVSVPSTATQCEHCVFTSNYFKALNTTPAPDGFFLLDAPGANPTAYVILRDNRFEDVVSPGPMTNPYAVTVNSTSGNGGAMVLIMEGNEIPSTLETVSNATNVAGYYRAIGNYKIGSSPLRYGVQATSDCIQATPPVGNVGGGTDDLMTCSIAANHIRANNVGVRIVASGITAANGNNKTVTVSFAGTTVFTTGAVAANNVGWRIACEGARSSSSGFRMTCQGNPLTASGNITTTHTILTGLDFTTATTVKATGAGTADDDVVQQYFHVELIR